MQSDQPVFDPSRAQPQDAWSPAIVLASMVGSLALVCLFVFVDFSLLFFILFIIISMIGITLIAAGMLITLLSDLKNLRIRSALSIAMAMAVSAGIFSTMFTLREIVNQNREDTVFYSRLARYEREVEKARSAHPLRQPLQIFVDCQDRSAGLNANLIYYIVYDETDRAGPYKSAAWPCSICDRTEIEVPVKSMHHITGHYYSFFED